MKAGSASDPRDGGRDGGGGRDGRAIWLLLPPFLLRLLSLRLL